MSGRNLFVLIFALVQSQFFLWSLGASAQSIEQKKRNITAFSKLYGYVQYFHPSDEAANLDWYSFSVYGVERVLKAKTDVELITTLNEIFKPMAPTINIFANKEKFPFNVQSITPSNPELFKIISWQHSGFHVKWYYHQIYQSIRLNRPVELNTADIIEKSYILTEPINGVKGKAFRVVTDIKSEEALTLKGFIDPKSGGLFKKDDTTKTSNKLKYSFSGTFGTKNEAVVFAFYTDSKSGISVNNLKLEVKNDTGYTEVPIKYSHSLNPAPDSCPQYTILGISMLEGKEKRFESEIKMGEYLAKELVHGITFNIPMALYGTKDYTYPKADTAAYQQLKIKLAKVWPTDAAGLEGITGAALKIRLSDLIIVWNILNHSFPYWKDASESPAQIWNKSLSKAFMDVTSDDFFTTLELMCAPLNDGHMFVVDDNPPAIEKATVPLLFEYAEDKIVVKQILDTLLIAKIRPGDELKTVDGKNALKLLLDHEKHYSGSPQWKRKKCLLSFINGVKGGVSEVTLIRNKEQYTLSLKRDAPLQGYVSGSDRNIRKAYEWLPDSIFYINLNKTTTEKQMESLVKARSIIIDMRGYLQEMNETFAGHLTKEKQIGKGTMAVPEILYPDGEKTVYKFGKSELNSVAPYIKAKVYILQDATAQSASESFTAYYKQFKLAKIIGEPSSGTNGDINVIALPGDYRIHYSGMFVQNPDGSAHHLRGVMPDVLVKPTLRSIKNSQDEVFDRAIAIAKSEQKD